MYTFIPQSTKVYKKEKKFAFDCFVCLFVFHNARGVQTRCNPNLIANQCKSHQEKENDLVDIAAKTASESACAVLNREILRVLLSPLRVCLAQRERTNKEEQREGDLCEWSLPVPCTSLVR